MSSWWTGLPPAQATLTCGAHTHRLRWQEGQLTAVDHGDLEAESALAALGGQRCICVEMIDAWKRHADDPRVLVLASRGPADPILATADWSTQLQVAPRALAGAPAPAPATPVRGPMGASIRRRASTLATQWVGRPPLSPVQGGRPPLSPAPGGGISLPSSAESELVALLGLGGALQDRLVAGVAAAWAERLNDPGAAANGALPALHASMQGRLAAVVRSWLGRPGVEVELRLIGARDTPAVSERTGVICAELPFRWLAEVWSRGLAIVLGRFCLAAETVDGRAWTLTAVGPELGVPTPIRVELPAAY